MKIKLYLRILFLCSSALLLTACPGERWEDFETTYTPIFMSYEEFEESIKVESPRTLTQTGKIYSYKQYIFMNETYQGVHIIDNSNPTEPAIVGFINIPGNIDIAIKDNVLYADSAVDLIALDLTNPLEVYVSKRISSIFPTMSPPDGGVFNYDESEGIIVGWEQ